MNALHIDVAQLSPEQMVAMAQAGLLSVNANAPHSQPVTETVTTEPVTETVTDDIVNHKGLPCSDANHPHTWTHERLLNTAVRGANRSDTLEAIARTFPGVNPIVILEGREIKDDSADHAVYHATTGKGKNRLVAAIEWLIANGNDMPASEPVKPVATGKAMPSKNGAAIAKLQAKLRELNSENDTIAKMVVAFPALAHTVTDRQAELHTMIDQLAGELAELIDKSDTRSAYAKIVGLTPNADKKVSAVATIAALGRVNDKAFNENAEFALRKPSVLKERYDNAVKHAATIRQLIAERDEYRAIATTKDMRQSINVEFAAKLDKLQEKIGYFSRAIEPTSVDRYQAYIWLRDGKVIANAVHGTMPDVEALERKAVELNADPGKTQRSNNAKKAAKTRRANKRNKK